MGYVVPFSLRIMMEMQNNAISTFFRKYCYGQIHFQNILKWGQLGKWAHAIRDNNLQCYQSIFFGTFKNFFGYFECFEENTIAKFKKVAESIFILFLWRKSVLLFPKHIWGKIGKTWVFAVSFANWLFHYIGNSIDTFYSLFLGICVP